tara:strand:+ start:1351 stop:1554 length:204 start_codon:yes stop_codon:yes gene_type:complete
MGTREDKAYKKHYERETSENKAVRNAMLKPFKSMKKVVTDFMSNTKKRKAENEKNKATLKKPKKQGY